MKRINVNTSNSLLIEGRLFITGLKMNALSPSFKDMIISGNTIVHPSLGTLYEFNGPYSRA